jgi:hypothetical protein
VARPSAAWACLPELPERPRSNEFDRATLSAATFLSCAQVRGVRANFRALCGWQRQAFSLALPAASGGKPSVSSEDSACRCHPTPGISSRAQAAWATTFGGAAPGIRWRTGFVSQGERGFPNGIHRVRGLSPLFVLPDDSAHENEWHTGGARGELSQGLALYRVMAFRRIDRPAAARVVNGKCPGAAQTPGTGFTKAGFSGPNALFRQKKIEISYLRNADSAGRLTGSCAVRAWMMRVVSGVELR